MDGLLEEIAALQATMMDNVSVEYDSRGRPSRVTTVISPATGDVVETQFVRVTLTLTLAADYPLSSPQISVGQWRGLCEERVSQLVSYCQQQAACHRGEPAIYIIFQEARDWLTDRNRPSVPCAICLYDFTAADRLCKTVCFHYFHHHCLARYIEHHQRGGSDSDDECEAEYYRLPSSVRQKCVKALMCPVCREPLGDALISSVSASDAPAPELCESAVLLTADTMPPPLVALQRQMEQQLLLRQSNELALLAQQKLASLEPSSDRSISSDPRETSASTNSSTQIRSSTCHSTAPNIQSNGAVAENDGGGAGSHRRRSQNSRRGHSSSRGFASNSFERGRRSDIADSLVGRGQNFRSGRGQNGGRSNRGSRNMGKDGRIDDNGRSIGNGCGYTNRGRTSRDDELIKPSDGRCHSNRGRGNNHVVKNHSSSTLRSENNQYNSREYSSNSTNIDGEHTVSASEPKLLCNNNSQSSNSGRRPRNGSRRGSTYRERGLDDSGRGLNDRGRGLSNRGRGIAGGRGCSNDFAAREVFDSQSDGVRSDPRNDSAAVRNNVRSIGRGSSNHRGHVKNTPSGSQQDRGTPSVRSRRGGGSSPSRSQFREKEVSGDRASHYKQSVEGPALSSHVTR